VAERRRLSPQRRQWWPQDLIVQLFPEQRREVRRYEGVRTAGWEAWQEWLAHRTTAHADLYCGLLAAEWGALVRAARDHPRLQRVLIAGLDAAIRYRSRAGRTLTEAQIEAFREGLSLLSPPD